MVDFNKKYHDVDKFRQAAIFFQQHGEYTTAPRGTTDYIQYWDRETERCLRGYVAPDGESISGYHYFYLNYFPILRLVEEEYTDRFGNKRKRFVRSMEFADFYDYDAYFFDGVDDAEDNGQHMCVLKARGRGYSYKAASMLVRNYELIPASQNFAVASEQSYLTNDGLLTKAWAGMDFIDKHTAWAKQRLVDTKLKRTSGFKVTDEFGKQVEDGYKSSIIGITTKNNPDRVRGIRGRLILWEEAGKFKDILQAWQIARPSVEDTGGNAYGLMMAFGTGGSVGADFEGLKEMFYHPDGYNIASYTNIWDEKAIDQKCGFFCPAWSNVTAIDPKTRERICMDKDGNSLRIKATEFCMEQRNKVRDGASEEVVIDRYVAENPLTPQESILEIGGNIFPKKLLMQQLSRIRTNTKLQNMKHIVDLSWDGNGKVIATEKKQGDITEYPLPKDKKPHGSVVIWEYPINDPPYGLYISGCLTPGEKVYTQRGLVNVEDVTLDDKLISKDGEFVDIYNLQRYIKVDEPIYTVKLSNTYRTTTFTGEHPLYVSNNYGCDGQFIKAKEVFVGQYAKVINKYANTNTYIDTPIKDEYFWWFVGLWLGDGWVDEKKHSISIAFDAKQNTFYDKYHDFLRKNGIRYYERFRKNTLEVNFTSKEVCNWLTNTFGKYAYGKHIPDNIKRISDRYKLQLIHGYLDSDGAVCINNKNKSTTIEFVSINLGLLEDIQDMCFALNIVGGITKLRDAKQAKLLGRTINQKETYHLRLSYSNSCALSKMLLGIIDFSDEKLQRINISDNIRNTNKNCMCIGDYIYFKIKEIKQSLYTGIVYNFECATHTFMCRNILTHNCDPYDHDDSFTNSLGSTFIYKRYKAGEAWNDVIVAEYSGRPDTAEEYYENVRKLLVFYNAKLLFENERKGIYPYFTNKHCDYLLADQPDKIISEVFKDSKVQRRKGCHMTKSIRQYGEGLIKEWLEEEYEPGHPNLERIYSEPLLEELIMNNGVRNVDRVIALCMVMIYREELYQVRVKDAKEQNKKVELFDMPLFSAQWWQTEDDVGTKDDIPTFYV